MIREVFQNSLPRLLGLILLAALLLANSAHAQTPAPPPAGAPAATPAPSDADTSYGFFQIVFSGGPIGIFIMLVLIGLSILAVTLGIENTLTIRAPILMPPGLAERVRDQIAAGSLAGAEQVCQTHPSLLAFILRAGLSEADGGWANIEKALEDATAEQAARLMRKVEYLSVIGNLAPMVGLLGTVTGMLFAFREVAETQGAARAAELAEGIYQALVTTVVGLLIAIPALGAFAVLRNRVDQFVAEAAYAALHVLAPLKRLRQRPPQGLPVPPPLERGQ